MTGAPINQANAPARVMLVTGAYFPEISSGGLQCQAVARYLGARARFRVLTTATDPTLPAHETVDGVEVSRVQVDVGSAGSKARAFLALLQELLRRVPRIDAVHLQGFSRKNILIVAIAKLFGRPTVLSLQTAGHDEPQTVAGQGRLASWAFSSHDMYLSVSPRLREQYLRAGLPPGRIRLVPNGVDVQRFTPATPDVRANLRRRLGLPVERPIVLFVGMFSRDKQPRVLFDAWLGLQRDPALASTLLFVGATQSAYYEIDPQLARAMRADAERDSVADRLVFVDPTHQVHDYFRAADMFSLPSAREGLPIALLEAMASGLPCVASRLPGSTDTIVEEGVNGQLVPPGDSDALAAALTALLRDAALAARMGERARETVLQRYGIGPVADAWVDAYAAVLGERS
jgi:glycosyltransferase involved in cell wall biosynthesis